MILRITYLGIALALVVLGIIGLSYIIFDKDFEVGHIWKFGTIFLILAGVIVFCVMLLSK